MKKRLIDRIHHDLHLQDQQHKDGVIAMAHIHARLLASRLSEGASLNKEALRSGACPPQSGGDRVTNPEHAPAPDFLATKPCSSKTLKTS